MRTNSAESYCTLKRLEQEDDSDGTRGGRLGREERNATLNQGGLTRQGSRGWAPHLQSYRHLLSAGYILLSGMVTRNESTLHFA